MGNAPDGGGVPSTGSIEMDGSLLGRGEACHALSTLVGRKLLCGCVVEIVQLC